MLTDRLPGPFRAIAAVALAAAAGCAGGPAPTPRNAPDWSRGIPLGETGLQLPVALEVGEAGAVVAWADREGRLRVAEIDSEGGVEEKALEVETVAPRAPLLVPGSAGELHLLWLDGEGRDVAVYYCLLGPELEPVTMARRVSPSGGAVTSLRAAPASAGGAHMVWGSGPTGENGLFLLTVDATGSAATEPRLIAGGAESPNLRSDVEGRLHLVWRRPVTYLSDDLYHAVIDADEARLLNSTRVATVSRLSGQVLEGPDIALIGDEGILLWAVEDRVRGGSRLFGLKWSGGSAETAVAERIVLPASHRPAYGADGEPVGPSVALQLASMGGPGGSGFTTQPRAGDPGWSHAWVAAASEIWTGARRDIQIAVVAVSTDGPLGYQIVTASRAASLEPLLRTGPGQSLHLAWLETGGFGTYQVTYASTAEGVRQTWNRVTVRDVVDTGLQGANTLLLAVGLLPFMLIGWVAGPLAVLILFFLWTGEERLVGPGSWILLALAMLVETLAMGYLLPSLQVAPTDALEMAGRWGIPLVLALPAGGVLALYLRRSEQPTLLTAFLAFALTHGTLRMVLLATSLVEVL